jgi:hypothetical protein
MASIGIIGSFSVAKPVELSGKPQRFYLGP